MERLCHASKVVGECDTCKKPRVLLHMPEHLHGWYCEDCCPICNHNQKRKHPPLAA